MTDNEENQLFDTLVYQTIYVLAKGKKGLMSCGLTRALSRAKRVVCLRTARFMRLFFFWHGTFHRRPEPDQRARRRRPVRQRLYPGCPRSTLGPIVHTYTPTPTSPLAILSTQPIHPLAAHVSPDEHQQGRQPLRRRIACTRARTKDATGV
jgi:hypothetical protein